MALFHTYSVICPIIEQNSFLGVNQDKENSNVLATLGRNIISKYRLSDQKQVGGWTSKDHITSPVVYDPVSQQYLGVFSNKFLKIWSADVQDLDKVKKYKFSENIIKIEICESIPSILIFANGNSASTPYAIQDRKQFQMNALVKSYQKIVDVAAYSIDNSSLICYIIESDGKYELWHCPLNEELGTIVKSRIDKIDVARQEQDVSIVGKLMNSKTPFVFFLWSDAKMFYYDLRNLKWKSVGSVQWISCDNQVSMQWIHNNHLALFGSDQNKDGALVVIYNVTLGISACRYPLKMYYEGAKLYSFEDNLVIEAGNHLASVHFTLEVTKTLAKLISSHEISDETKMELASWDEDCIPNIVCSGGGEQVELLKKGVTMRQICIQYMLPLFEDTKNNIDLEMLKQFSDIPESVIVLLMKHLTTQLQDDSDSCHDLEQMKIICNSKKDLKLKLCYVLNLPLSENLVIPHIKQKLKLEDCLFMINFICILLSESDAEQYYNEQKLLNWFLLLLDSFYKHNIILKDQKILKVLQNSLNVVLELLGCLKGVNNILPKLYVLKRKQIDEEHDLQYSIQLIKLF